MQQENAQRSERAAHGARSGAVAVLAALSVVAAGCASSSGTTAIEPTRPVESQAPTTSIARAELPTTTAPPAAPVRTPANAPSGELTATLGTLVGTLAADPALARLLAGGLELPELAALAGIEVAQLEQLGLTPEQLSALAASVLAQTPPVLEGLIAGPVDPAALLAVLAGSVPVGELAGGAVGALVAALVAAIGDLRINPQLTIQLGELLEGLDPNRFGNISADPNNAAFLALLLSAFIGSNPVLAEQLLSNELLEPSLRELLGQLRELNATLSDAARAALLETLTRLFPDLLAALARA